MKKLFNVAIVALALSFGLSSCGNEDPASPLTVNTSRTATIEGVVLVNANETATPAKYSAPENAVTVEALIPYSSLIPGGGATGNYRVTGTTNADGTYSLSVPVGANPTTVTVKVLGFKGSVRKTVSGTDKTINVYWKSQTKSAAGLSQGDLSLQNFTLNGSAYYEEVKSDGSEI